MSIKRQFLWNMAPMLIVTAINFFSVPMFVRFLGAEKYGLWYYVLTFTGSFGFADLGLGVAVGRYIGIALGRGDHEAVRQYWGTGNMIAIPLLAAMALVFGVVGTVFGPHLVNVSPENESLLRGCFVAGGFGLFFAFYAQFWNILTHAHLDFKFSGLARVCTTVLQVIPSLVIARYTGNPFLIVAWTALVGLVQVGLFAWYSRRRFGLGFNLASASIARAREMAAYTGKTFAGLLFNSFFGQADRLVLGKLAAPASFTYYSIASSVGGRIQALSAAVMGPVFQNTCRSLGDRRAPSVAEVYNHTFEFTFGWYLLLSVWIAVWHPVLLRLWLGADLGTSVSPVFVPVIIACCLTSISNISGAQLGPLDRVGAGLGYNVLTCLLVVIGVYMGWKWGGATGVAYGFLFSRLGCVAQDLFVIRLVGGGGWLDRKTWLHIAAQCCTGAFFATSFLLFRSDSFWLLLPAMLHGGVVAAWLLRHRLRKLVLGTKAPRGSSLRADRVTSDP